MHYIKAAIDQNSKYTDELYTYGCEFDVSPGCKVRVPFGRGSRLKDAYVFDVMEEPDGDYPNLKYVAEVDETVSLLPETMELCRWMRDRYFCRYIEAVRLCLPAGAPRKRKGPSRNPFERVEAEQQPIERLTPEQEKVLQRISSQLAARQRRIFLLHGVTGSGKTEVYMRAIARTLEQGRTAIMLVPEISLTKQIIDRFAARFGSEELAILHSGLSAGERYSQWQRIRSGRARVVVGARSAVFCPLQNIGLVIMDEEHEDTYKSDKSPKYDTLEVAIKRTVGTGGVIILGSATPSVVSYERARQGIYELLELKERYNRVPLPRVETVDMRRELSMGNTTVISRRLYGAMEETLSEGSQVILFMNRRGYSTFVSCRKCGHVVECPKCGVSLTYHRAQNACVCHYCGYTIPMPKVCPECGSPHIKGFGTGTEKVMETVERLFPDYPAVRLDLDSMRRKGETRRILNDFGKGKTRILVGTQVVAKGLDYRNVGLVGVISCDVMLNIPDYRAPERAFQLITQAAGRSGRGDRQGLVIIQTYTPEHYAVRAAAAHDYAGFFEEELARRRLWGYPPFTDMIQVVFSSKDHQSILDALEDWRREIIRAGGDEGQIIAAKGQVYNREEADYKECLLIRSPKSMRSMYLRTLAGLKERDRLARREYSVVIDVNPYSLWRI